MKNNFLLLFLLFTAFGLQSAAQNKEMIFKAVDEPPIFPGGEDTMLQYLANNINYPKEAKKNNKQGIVYVEFAVNTDGSLSDYKVVRDIGGGCGQEVIRVLKLMPKWKPAKHEGQLVRQYFILPVSFYMEDEDDKPPRKNAAENKLPSKK